MSKHDMRELEGTAKRILRMANDLAGGVMDKDGTVMELRRIASNVETLASHWRKDLERAGED